MRKKIILGIFVVFCALGLAACGAGTDSSDNSAGNSDTAVGHKHTLQHLNAAAPTCRDTGNLEAWYCAACGNYFLEETAENPVTHEGIVLDKLPHTADFHEAVESGCGKDGNVAYYSCSSCNKYFSDEACTTEITDKNSVVIPAEEHLALTHFDAVYGYKEAGVAEHWFCDVCDNYYLDAEGTSAVTEEELHLTPAYDVPDFVVEVAADKTPIVLQLSDTQIIDAAQAREGREGVYKDFWATDQVEERCYDYLTEVITATQPDLIIITGDVIYGEFDDNGSALLSFVSFMDSFQIPWAPVFGNHDNESKKGVDWQCEQFENAEYCLFEQKELTGNGNYSVGIAQGEVITRVFYMMDTNACAAASAESLANGHTASNLVGFAQDQIDWYTAQITELKLASPNTKISFAYHIQPYIFVKAYQAYGFNQTEKYQDINIDTHADKAEGDFGYIGRQLKGPWDSNYAVFNAMKAMGVDSIFVGHEHCNSSSVVYEGVRFQFGQKSSEYDRFNCINANGVISGGYTKTGISLIGGTVIPLSEDGSIVDPYIYYCGFENGQIDWNDINGSLEKPDNDDPVISVNGLKYGGISVTTAELWADGAVVAEAVAFDETTNAYKVTANTQGKFYINTGLLAGKTTVSFTVYMPSTSTAKLGGYGQFAIRTKPNDKEPSIDGTIDGYIDYDTDSKVESLKLEYDKWQTFTVDITENADAYTEFAFVIAQGNTIYLRDIAVS